MATDNSWLTDGFQTGLKEITDPVDKANKLFDDWQKTLDKAYDIGTKAETQDSTIASTNAQNQNNADAAQAAMDLRPDQTEVAQLKLDADLERLNDPATEEAAALARMNALSDAQGARAKLLAEETYREQPVTATEYDKWNAVANDTRLDPLTREKARQQAMSHSRAEVAAMINVDPGYAITLAGKRGLAANVPVITGNQSQGYDMFIPETQERRSVSAVEMRFMSIGYLGGTNAYNDYIKQGQKDMAAQVAAAEKTKQAGVKESGTNARNANTVAGRAAVAAQKSRDDLRKVLIKAAIDAAAAQRKAGTLAPSTPLSLGNTPRVNVPTTIPNTP